MLNCFGDEIHWVGALHFLLHCSSSANFLILHLMLLILISLRRPQLLLLLLLLLQGFVLAAEVGGFCLHGNLCFFELVRLLSKLFGLLLSFMSF